MPQILIFMYGQIMANTTSSKFIFYHARSTDFEEKTEGLWTGSVLKTKQKNSILRNSQLNVNYV